MFAETTTPVFALGVLFGALLLFLGIWIGRQTIPIEAGSLDNYHLRKILRALFHWTDDFASDVSTYRQLMDQVKEQVSAVEQEHMGQPTPVVSLLSKIVQVNDALQKRLDTAEKTLQGQATEIAAYLSEARTDTLTGLPNRRVFEDELSRRLAEFRRHGTPLSVMIVDIDHFKRFNDQHGHLAGDQVLVQVASVLRNTMRESDLVARLGGEEFAIVLPCTDAAEASQAAERARCAVEQAMFLYEGASLRVTVSCGVARVSAGEDATALVKRADQALYASKACGRNFAHCHDGQGNIPITLRDPLRPESPSPSPDDPSSAPKSDFLAVCDELRQRVRSVIESN